MSRSTFIGAREYFPNIQKITFEGPESDNPLAFKVYDPNRVVADRSMEEWLRFAVCYWHTFTGAGTDQFGAATREFPWDDAADAKSNALQRLDAAFEFFSKLRVPFFCFHDRDLAPEQETPAQTETVLMELVGEAKVRMAETGVKLLWGTANLFSNPIYMNGAATNPDFTVVAHAAAQVKAALDATVELGGANYVFWGGREGYSTLLNTNTKLEQDNFARFLTAARDYGRSIGFNGTFLIEPKPMEPMKHQYDFDALTVIGFLRHHGLDGEFKLNIEANHATLAGHSFAHELQMCADAGLLGSIDANRGDPLSGWDTDQFPLDMNDCIQAMLIVMSNGGIAPGGLNFDAKLRRESVDMGDLFLAHVGAMDAFARALVIADRIQTDGRLMQFRSDRYASFDLGPGKQFVDGELGIEDLYSIADANPHPEHRSGKQESLENLVNEVMFRGVDGE